MSKAVGPALNRRLDPRIWLGRLKRRIGSEHSRPTANGAGDETNASYWSRHNVTQHRTFRTRDESLEYLAWRNAEYLFYDELIPMPDLDGAVVLDFGCGPGHDLVAITERARPARLIGMDVASTSLAEARARLALHGVAEPELVLLDEGSPHIPLDDASVDFFVSSGVLHHIPDVEAVLRELHRVLRPGGRGRVMVYNRDSIWVHLYVPFVRQLAERIDAELRARRRVPAQHRRAGLSAFGLLPPRRVRGAGGGGRVRRDVPRCRDLRPRDGPAPPPVRGDPGRAARGRAP